LSGDRLLDVVEDLRKKCLAKEEENCRILQLTETEYKGLLSLGNEERITCREFSLRMNLSVSRGSRIIERLHAKGYLDRADSCSDRRRKYVYLTPKGAAVRNKIDAQRQLCEKILVSAYSEAKLKKLKKELLDLTEKFEKL